jgi:hypothetical protein
LPGERHTDLHMTAEELQTLIEDATFDYTMGCPTAHS